MPEIQIVPAGVTVAPCPNCGEPAGLASGTALRDGEGYARYLLDWCENSARRRALLTMSIGDWSEAGEPARRTSVAVEMGREGWRLTDAPEREDLEGWGEFAPDAEVRRRDAVDQVRAMARLIMFEDPAAAEVNAWTIEERESALPVDPADEEARTERPDSGQSSNSA